MVPLATKGKDMTDDDLVRAELEALQRKYAAVQVQKNNLIHMLEQRPAVKIWPVHVKCRTPRCHSALAFDPLPDEVTLTAAILAARWQCDGDEHVCPRCQR